MGLPNQLPTRSALPLAAHEKFVENIIHSIVRIVYIVHNCDSQLQLLLLPPGHHEGLLC